MIAVAIPALSALGCLAAGAVIVWARTVREGLTDLRQRLAPRD